jgi:hypothetical protein
MSGNNIEEQWNALSPEEKLNKLEPRVMLMVNMICDIRDNIDHKLLSDNFLKGLDVLNISKDRNAESLSKE